MIRVLGGALVIVGCSKPRTTPPDAAAPAVTSVTAPSVAASVAPQHIDPTVPSIDTTDWKDAPPGSTLEVTWTADHRRMKPPLGKERDLTKHIVPLRLTMMLAGHTHSVDLETNAALPILSDTCARVTFFHAGSSTIFLLGRSGQRGALWRSQTSQTAPTTNEQLYAFDLPADVKMAQETVVIPPKGKDITAKCAAPALR